MVLIKKSTSRDSSNVSLKLHNNFSYFTDEFDTSLAFLRSLSISKNRLTNVPHAILELKDLVKLHLEENKLVMVRIQNSLCYLTSHGIALPSCVPFKAPHTPFVAFQWFDDSTGELRRLENSDDASSRSQSAREPPSITGKGLSLRVLLYLFTIHSSFIWETWMSVTTT